MTKINAQINPSQRIVAKHVTMHNVSKATVGLENVDNTPDANKPISALTQAALDLKANQSTTYTKTEVDAELANLVNGAPGQLDTLNELAAALGDDQNYASTISGQISSLQSLKADQTSLNTHIADNTNPHSVDQTQVGLDKVDNTTDAEKPVSTAQQAALDLKAPIDSPQFTGNSILFQSATFDDITEFRKKVKIFPVKGLGLHLSSSASNNQAVSARVEGPVTVGHDLFQRSGFTGGFGDGSNHFHSLIDINRIEQEAEGDVKNTERVQERYYAVQDNFLPNNKAVFWAQHRVARTIGTELIDTSTATLDVSLLQNSTNRNADNQAFFVSNSTPLNKSEKIEIKASVSGGTLTYISIDNQIRMTFGQAFSGPIVAASLFGKVTAVGESNDVKTVEVELYGGNYKTTVEVPLGTDQTALTFDEVKLEKIGINTIVQSGNETNLQLYSKTNFTPDRLKDETLKATWSVAHGLVKNEHCTLITDGRGDLVVKQSAYVLDPDPDSDGLSVILVYGRRVKQFDLSSFTAFGSSNWTLHKGTVDGIHDDTLGDNLINFNANKHGEYTAYQIGPGSQTDADCISIGKNVYNKDASTIKIGYDNAMLDVRSDGVVVAGGLTVDQIATFQDEVFIDGDAEFDGDVEFKDLVIANNIAGKSSNGAPAPIVIEGGTTTSVGALGGGTLVLEGGESPNNTAYHGNITIGPFHTGGVNIGQKAVTTTQVFGEFRVDSDTTANPFTLKVDTANDRVGINKDAPAEALDVVGNMNITGKITTEGGIDFSGGDIKSISYAGILLSGTGGITMSGTGNLTVNGLGKISAGSSGIEVLSGGDIEIAHGSGKLKVGTSFEVNALDGSITGSNLTLSGDLTVNGTTTTINTTNLDVDDNLITLNKGIDSSSTNPNDIGFIFERGTSGNNAAILWDESEEHFLFGTSTTDASNSGAASNYSGGKIAASEITAFSNMLASKLFLRDVPANAERQLYFENNKFFAGNHAVAAFSVGLNNQKGDVIGIDTDDGNDLDISAPNDITLTPGGNVGIGKVPSTGVELDVNGDIAASGNITGKIITNEIQCEGTTSGTAQPIRYDAREHRFRDFNETPSDLMVIKMIAGEGGRVGINTDDPKATLHVVGEGSSGYPANEAIRCTGGLRISDWLRLGPYTDSERDAIGLDPPQGLVIYNEEHDKVQAFIANPSGSGRGTWKSFVDASLDGSTAITGDLTVDTNTLKVDSTNNRVGIGTATPGAGSILSVVGDTTITGDITTSGTNPYIRLINQPSGNGAYAELKATTSDSVSLSIGNVNSGDNFVFLSSNNGQSASDETDLTAGNGLLSLRGGAGVKVSDGDFKADSAELGINGGNITFSGPVTCDDDITFGGSLIGVGDLIIDTGGSFQVDTDVLVADGTLDKVGIKHTPTADSANLHVNGSVTVQDGSEKSLVINPTTYSYKIGDIDSGENGVYLELDSTSVFARLHGTGLSIGKALTSGKRLDVAGDTLMNNLEVDGTLSVPGELTTSTDIELTDGAGINATGDIATSGAILPGTFANTAARDAAITSPEAGMIVFVTDGDGSGNPKFQGYTGSGWVDFH